MTITDVIKMNEGKFVDVEVYRGDTSFHTDQIRWVENYSDDENVISWKLIDEDEYDHTVLANTCEFADFAEWYDDENVQVLCILI